MRILVACRAIKDMAGGVERQSLALIKEMNARGHDARLITLDPARAEAFYEIERMMHWYKLDMGDPSVKASWALRFRRMKRVREIMKEFKPDVILAFQQGMFLSMRLYTAGTGIPVVAAERESPYRYDFVQEGKHRDLIFQTYRLAPRITVQCESYIAAYPEYLQARITVIPNSVFPSVKRAKPEGESGKEKILLCVGRLTYQKNQLALLDAFSSLTDRFPDWKLVLAGEGDYRPQVEQKIKDLNLAEKVELLGAVKNVPDLYAGAQALCIPSYWEGFPNVLGEALAHGLPAVGYQGCGGVRDLIHNGENGLLAAGNGDVETLRQALAEIMSDDARRKDMGKRAAESIEVYSPSAVYDKWESLCKEFER